MSADDERRGDDGRTAPSRALHASPAPPRASCPTTRATALFDAAPAGRERPAAEPGHLRRDRGVVREVHGLPRRGGRSHRSGPVQHRPSPRLGGEPAGMGAPRPRRRRPGHRSHRHPALLAPHDRRRPGSGRSVVGMVGQLRRHRLALADPARPAASSTAATATSRPGPTSGAGRPTWRSAAGWPSTTSSPTRPTAVDPPTSCGRAALASGEFVEDGECGSLRVLRRVAPPTEAR